jgi:glycosyltransferase involved in cell wall biosynthesis
MGFRYPPEPWLAACDIFLVPAVHEPFGRTIIEGMLIGTPVVATASGGNLEAIEDGKTGFLVPVEGTAQMASRAIELLTLPELHRAISAQARLDAEQRFGVTRHVKAVMDIYEKLLGSERPVVQTATGSAAMGTRT